MLYLAIVDKLNRAGFVVAPYNTPEEVPSVKSVSGPARHVGEADKRVRDSRGGSPCGENRCGPLCALCPSVGSMGSSQRNPLNSALELLVLFRFLKRCHTFLVFLIVIVAASEVRCF